MDSCTNLPLHHHDGAILATPMGGAQGGGGLLAASLAYGSRTLQLYPGTRLLDRGSQASAGDEHVPSEQVLRVDGRPQKSGLAGLLHHLIQGILRRGLNSPPHPEPTPSLEETTDFQASFAEAKQHAAFTKQVITERRWEWAGRSDHPWAQVIRGGPEERHR